MKVDRARAEERRHFSICPRSDRQPGYGAISTANCRSVRGQFAHYPNRAHPRLWELAMVIAWRCKGTLFGVVAGCLSKMERTTCSAFTR
jgi:hypothetical protein